MKPGSGLAAGISIRSVIAMLALTASLCRSRQPEVITSSRSLLEAVRLLEERYRKPVTYEDTISLWPGDKERNLRVKQGPGYRHPLVPKERSFIFPPGLSPDRTPVLDETALRKVLDAYHSQTDGPRFRVLTSSYGLHIVPVKARDASGTWVDVRSPLDSFIDLPVTNQIPSGHIVELCRAVTEASGIVVKSTALWLDDFFLPQGTFSKYIRGEEMRAPSITWGGRMRARDALINFVQLSETTLTWELRCSAEPDRFYDWNYGCALDLRPIEIRVIRSDGSVGGRTRITHDRSKKKPAVPE